MFGELFKRMRSVLLFLDLYDKGAVALDDLEEWPIEDVEFDVECDDKWICAEELIVRLAEEWTKAVGSAILDKGRLEGAIAGALMKSEYTGRPLNEAVLEEIARLHPLSDGNKRLAVLAYVVASAIEGKARLSAEEIRKAVRSAIEAATA